MAKGFAKNGAKIMIADLNEAAALQTIKEIEEAGGTAAFTKTNVMNVAECQNLVDETVKAFGGVHILLNIAGICKGDELFNSTEAIYDLTMGVNVKGMLFLSEAAARVMKEQPEKGTIINVCSTSGYISSSTPMIAYDISKGAVRMLTMTMANWYAQYGIRVNAIAPATTMTDMVRNAFEPGYWETPKALVNYPLGRIAETDDHLNAMLFLCSEDAGYINGQILKVDGGNTMAYRNML